MAMNFVDFSINPLALQLVITQAVLAEEHESVRALVLSWSNGTWTSKPWKRVRSGKVALDDKGSAVKGQ